MEEEKKQQAQQKYFELQLMNQQMNQLREQAAQLEKQMAENRKIQESLTEFSELKEGKEILAPLASGIFIKAQIQESANVLVNVGGNTVVPKDVGSAKELMKSQLEELNKVRDEILGHLETMQKEASKTEQELMKLV